MAITNSNNPLSTQEPWSVVSGGYEQTTMLFLEYYSSLAIELATIHPDFNVLDLACGPGTLSRLIYQQVKHITAVDFSEEMIDLCDRYIETNTIRNIKTVLGDGQDLDLKEAQFDRVFSMFGLMFFPDRMKGFLECYRVLKPGGQLIVSSWAPISQSPAMQLMFGIIRSLRPDRPKPESNIKSLECKVTFEKELAQAGFSAIEIHPFQHTMAVPSAATFWDDMVLGSAPIAWLKKSVDTETWESMHQTALSYIESEVPHFPTNLSADAWIAVSTK